MIQTPPQKKDRALLAAQYFIWKNQGDDKGLDKLKLQKLLYYAQAWNLVFNKKKFFTDEIEAWVHGPAIPRVYRAFKEFDFEQLQEIDERQFSVFLPKERELLDEIWRVYGKYDGQYLELLTHNELPWQQARKGLGAFDASQNVISIESMRDFYGKRLAEAKAGTAEAN